MSKIIKTLNKNLTEAKVLALTNQNTGDTFVSTDTNKVFTIDENGFPFEDTKKDVIFVNDETITSDVVPLSIATANRIDSRASKFQGIATGSTGGIHKYNFVTEANTVDLLGATTPATILLGTNVTLLAPDSYEKSITGNTWNSYIYSQESFDPTTTDFAVSWLVENVGLDGDDGVTGTIREMGGLDNNPTQNGSYSSIEFAIYQVNNYFYSRVYEGGAAIIIPNYTTFYFQIGDRMGVKCIDGVVSYFVIRGTTETVIYTSLKKATEPLFFKAAFNRGDGSSGHSELGGVVFHVAQKKVIHSVEILGESTADITDEDKEKLKTVGIENVNGKYSDILFDRSNGSRFNNSGTPYNLDYSHSYFGVVPQDLKIINF